MTAQSAPDPTGPRARVLWLSTVAFTVMFNVWLMLGVLGISIRRELNLQDWQLEWLVAAAILSGSLLRLNFGIWADKYGGRNVFIFLLLLSAIPTYLFSLAHEYWELVVCALLFGLAGNSFSAGIAWCSAWYPANLKGTALGIFGAGNVGASGTKLLVILVPNILTLVPTAGYLGGWIPGGWRIIPVMYAVMLVLMALAIWLLAPVPDLRPGSGRRFVELIQPLKHVRVWRFSLYYIIVFGAYVALSGWLPKYYVDVYRLDMRTAALYTAIFIFPASLLRPLGGWLSDRYGPRIVTYAVFLAMAAALILLSLPQGEYFSLSAGMFTALIFVVGCGMGIGKASVYKYIPNYFPQDVGAVGGLVGSLGALGGFILPPIFGWLGRSTGVPQMAFVSLLVLTIGSLAWLHAAVLQMRAGERKAKIDELPMPEGAAAALNPASTS